MKVALGYRLLSEGFISEQLQHDGKGCILKLLHRAWHCCCSRLLRPSLRKYAQAFPLCAAISSQRKFKSKISRWAVCREPYSSGCKACIRASLCSFLDGQLHTVGHCSMPGCGIRGAYHVATATTSFFKFLAYIPSLGLKGWKPSARRWSD